MTLHRTNFLQHLSLKIVLAAAVSTSLFYPQSYAYLSASSITSATFYVHGLYTSDDPTCATGWVATIPLTQTAQKIDFTTSPSLGSGSVASPLQCVALILANYAYLTWASGSYSTSTTIQGATYQDQNCSAGGSFRSYILCNNSKTPYWPDEIATDMTATGLSMTTTCPANPLDQTEGGIIPLYMSVNSTCTGVPSIDSDTCLQSSPMTGPVSAADESNGVALSVPSATQSSYTFVIDVSNIVGGYAAGSCAPTGAPRFSFQ